MRNAILFSLAVLSLNAFALKTEADDVKPVFLEVESGKQLSAIEATQDALKGKRILKCQEVEAHASSKGNITLKKKSN
jgi:hypothetical protein